MEKLLYTNGRIYTMEQEYRQAEAVLTENGRIVDVGCRRELENKADEIFDLQGKTMLPAFLDSHGHLMGVANGMLQVDLSEAVSFAEVKEKILCFIKENQVPQGKWILAKGINHGNLQEKQLPPKSFLDGITSLHPLLIQHTSGHSGVLNTMGLERLEITANTLAPAGGRIDFEKGLLEENALIQRMDAFPLPTGEELILAFEKAQKLYASYGITTAQEGMFVEQIQGIYEMLYREKKLWLDVVAYMDLKNSPWLLDVFPECKGKYHHHFKVGGYKVLLDGSPQSKTAWVREPYTDGTKGYPMLSDEELTLLVERAVTEKQQLLMHANGDAAAEQYLRVYAEVKQRVGSALRSVLIHGQITSVDQIAKMAALGVTPSFFLAHIYHWGDIHLENLGRQRASRISAAHDAFSYGLAFTLHQDAPVIAPNMLETIGCAVQRRTKGGILLGGEQRLTPWEAILGVTKHAAMQYGEEGEKGTIREGKSADFVILNGNPMELDGDEIKGLQVDMTIKAGKVLFERK